MIKTHLYQYWWGQFDDGTWKCEWPAEEIKTFFIKTLNTHKSEEQKSPNCSKHEHINEQHEIIFSW